jgi:hypothetical protein
VRPRSSRSSSAACSPGARRTSWSAGWRSSFIAHKALSDLPGLANRSLLTARGRSLYDTFAAAIECVRHERAELWTGYTMANQPYNFSYDVFKHMNPMP